MVVRGLTKTRARARDLILRGEVCVESKVAIKAGLMVDETSDVRVSSGANRYVARSGLKLEAALKKFGLPVEGRVVLDIGASTGGFSQVLLEHGARLVYCVDVGHGQLNGDISTDPRVCDMSGVDARSLSVGDFAEPVCAITADVSFISLRKALPEALRLARPGSWIVALVKPQFELTPEALGKGGIVRDECDRRQAIVDVCDFLQRSDWRVEGTMPSPLPGKRGNIEHLVVAHLCGD